MKDLRLIRFGFVITVFTMLYNHAVIANVFKDRDYEIFAKRRLSDGSEQNTLHRIDLHRFKRQTRYIIHAVIVP
jgi:hypothetical protein